MQKRRCRREGHAWKCAGYLIEDGGPWETIREFDHGQMRGSGNGRQLLSERRRNSSVKVRSLPIIVGRRSVCEWTVCARKKCQTPETKRHRGATSVRSRNAHPVSVQKSTPHCHWHDSSFVTNWRDKQNNDVICCSVRILAICRHALADESPPVCS